MSTKIYLLFLCVIRMSSAYSVCDGELVDATTESLINSHIDRLMELRRPNWGWINTPDVILNVMLSNQQRLFGLQETLVAMETELRNEINDTTVGKLSLYATALKATCRDPRNFAGADVVAKLKRKMKYEFGHRSRHLRTPKHGWYQYGLAIQALCICDVDVSKNLVLKLIKGQKKNGGYGDHNPTTGDTSQVLLALQCVKPRFLSNRLHEKVERAINKAVKFLQSKVINKLDDVWIGDKYSTPAALLALKESVTTDNSHKWYCNHAMKSISRTMLNSEPEAALSQRLPALRGKSILSLKSSWTCEASDPIPNEYRPQYQPEVSFDCSRLMESPSVFSIFPFIGVRLSVQKTIGANSSAPYDLTLLVEDVEKDSTLLDIMAKARCREEFRFGTQYSSFGSYLTSVDGLEADISKREYWSLLKVETGHGLSLGIDQYKPSHDDHILLQLSVY